MSSIVLFDGLCNLCNGAVDFIIRRDPSGEFCFCPLQSQTASHFLSGRLIPEEVRDAIILVEGGHCYVRSTAWLRIARRLSGFWPLLYVFIIIPRPVRDGVYNWIARHRYRWFGKRSVCRVPLAETKDRFLA
jgi:predicted DCC family thiol-disulfide oxidoreductase YuxK